MQDYPNFKDLDGNDLTMDNDQFDLEMEHSAELFDCSQIDTRNHLDNGGMGFQLKENNVSVTESNALIKSAIEVTTNLFSYIIHHSKNS